MLLIKFTNELLLSSELGVCGHNFPHINTPISDITHRL